VRRLAVANEPNIFQMLLVLLVLAMNFVSAAIFVYPCTRAHPNSEVFFGHKIGFLKQ